MKKCGYKEECFENGEKIWGHMGNVLCLHADEILDVGVTHDFCMKSKELVRIYLNEQERNK